jgi:hypothetical protein
MSYDLQIWSVRPAAASDVLPNPTTRIADGQSWVHERRDWQIVIGRSVKVLPEDVPEAVAQALPGITYLTELNLSPIDAPEAARKFLSRSTASVAKQSTGWFLILRPIKSRYRLGSRGLQSRALPRARASSQCPGGSLKDRLREANSGQCSTY